MRASRDPRDNSIDQLEANNLDSLLSTKAVKFDLFPPDTGETGNKLDNVGEDPNKSTDCTKAI